MLVDGRSIAKNIETQLARVASGFSRPPSLSIIIVGDDPVIESFVRTKKRAGERIGVSVVEHRFAANTVLSELHKAVAAIAADPMTDGIIVQLPLPSHVPVKELVDAVPIGKDVDVLSQQAVAAFRDGASPVLPPVAGAIQEILERYAIDVRGKESLVLGYGRLVGIPARILLEHNGAHVTVIDKPVADLAMHVRESAIIISGVGSPQLITKDMLSVGAVVIDAGTSESGGVIVGDAHPDCGDVAALMTPVPGGVGPIAIAMLFKNLLVLAGRRASGE